MESFALALNIGKGIFQYEEDKVAAKAQRALQQYHNTMVNLSAALNQNAITTNEVLSNQQSINQSVELKKNYLNTVASDTVAAGAAGVTGRSVHQVMFDAQRNYNIAEGVRQETLKDSWLAFDTQRQQTAMNAKMEQDNSYIPKPSFFGTMLGAVAHTAEQGGYGKPGVSFASSLGF